MKSTLRFAALLLLAACTKAPAQLSPATENEAFTSAEGSDFDIQDSVVIDLQFYNADGVNPLGFGTKAAASESKEGETYQYGRYAFVLSRGESASAAYSYDSLALVYPAGTSGKCLNFKGKGGWIKVPGISGFTLHSILFEHGNGYVKQMVVKSSLDPSVSIAWSLNNPDKVASESGPSSELISFYSDGATGENVSGTPEEGRPYYLQFITAGGTRVYRIRLVYTKVLPKVPGPTVSESALPKVLIDTQGAEPIVSKEEYVYGSIVYRDSLGIYPGSRTVVERDSARFRGRGNTTWNKFAKKPYKIKLASKASFFGLQKDKEWCLLANYSDKSLMRNLVAMKISSILGFDWTPAMYPVELWLNGRYEGVYCLSEHKKVATHRINIKVPEDGGQEMYLEIDQLMDETTCFKTERMGIPVMFSDPEMPSEDMLSETKTWFAALEDALAGDGTGAYSDYLDIPSFVNHYIIQELSKNIDGRMNKGAFFTRSVGGPLRICHEWDFDIAFGNCDKIQTLSGMDNGPEGFLIKDWTGSRKGEGWYPCLFRDPDFVRKVKARWNEVYPELLTIPSFIESTAAALEPAAESNFKRWPILGHYVWPNVSWPASYSEEVSNLKNFYSARIQWLNTNINSL